MIFDMSIIAENEKKKIQVTEIVNSIAKYKNTATWNIHTDEYHYRTMK